MKKNLNEVQKIGAASLVLLMGVGGLFAMGALVGASTSTVNLNNGDKVQVDCAGTNPNIQVQKPYASAYVLTCHSTQATTTTTAPPTTTTTIPPTTTTTIPPTTTTTTQPQGNLATAPLPGEPILSSGVGSYLFGYNNGPEYAQPASSGIPSVQANIKSAGLTLDRVWGFDGNGNGTASGDGATGKVATKIAAVKAEGATCLFELGSQDDLAWMESIVSAYGNGTCPYFEFGNEPDYNGVFNKYTAQWNADIPTLKALCTAACYFGGPVLSWEGSNGGDPGPQPDDMQYFLAHANPAPDFVTFHDYPCSKSTSKAACLGTAGKITTSDTYGDMQYNWSNALADEKAILGHTLPTGITEVNFDPGSSNLGNWYSDASFMTQWTQVAWDSMVQLGVPFANIYTALDYGAYGELDIFNDSSPYAAKPQFYGLASEVQKYGGPATLTLPNPLP